MSAADLDTVICFVLLIDDIPAVAIVILALGAPPIPPRAGV